MRITPTFVKKKTIFGKVYFPVMLSFGRVREYRRLCKTATQAQDYAKRAVKHFEGMYCNGN